MIKFYILRQSYRSLLFLLIGIFSQSFLLSQTFSDVAAQFDINFGGNNATFGNGVSFYDFNNDGWDDVTFAPDNDSLHIYKNLEGTLVKMPSPFFISGDVKQILWVDYDNDRLLDLFITLNVGSNRLFKNMGNFIFQDVTQASGLLTSPAITSNYGASFADYNKDGFLDLYVVTYAIGNVQPVLLNKLYRNNGDGTFTDMTICSGTSMPGSTSFQCLWFDVNNNSWPDLYVINDRIFSNYLFINNGDETFIDQTLGTGLELPGQNCMGGTLGDFDNDGFLDLYIPNTSDAIMYSILLRNNGNGTFSDISQQAGVGADGVAWGCVWIDYDNDTWQDLYVTNASLGYTNEITENHFYRNNQGTSFSLMDNENVFEQSEGNFSYCVARGDLNNDGFYDMALSNAAPFVNSILLNSGNENNYIKITLEGTISNSFAIGSYIRVFVDGRMFTQYTLCGENYLGQNSQHHIFGLGDYQFVDSVLVAYPSGHIDRYYQLEANNTYRFKEGETYLINIMPGADIQLCEGESVNISAGEHAAYNWSNGSNEPAITVTEAGIYTLIVTNELGINNQVDINVQVNPLPDIEASVTQPSCNGFIDGIILLNNQTGIPAAEVLWNGIEGDIILSSLSDGFYNYTFTDLNACSSSGIVSVIDPDPLVAILSITDATQPATGIIAADIFGGIPPYTLWLNGTLFDNPATNLNQGDYWVEIRDVNDCLYADSATVGGILGIYLPSALSSNIYPNPVHDVLLIKPSIAYFEFKIYDISGRKVLEGSADQGRIDQVKNLLPGHYILQLVQQNNAVKRFRFVKH